MIYLDNSATTRTLPQAAQRAMNAARTTLASAIGASAEELYFTSGGTESNNMAIFGALEPIRGRGRIIVGATEHPSVFEPFQKLARQYDMQIAWVDGQGCIDLNGLEKLLTPDTLLVSIMQVNNEVGAINDIPSIRLGIGQPYGSPKSYPTMTKKTEKALIFQIKNVPLSQETKPLERSKNKQNHLKR